MKLNKFIYYSAALAISGVSLSSCSDFLDKEPMSQISPENYYSTEAQIRAVVLDEYPNTLPSHGNWSYGLFNGDGSTDNQIYVTADNKYTPDLWLVANTHGTWSFTRIYYINFMLSNALARYGSDINGSENTIDGSLPQIKHALGEGYFLRAYQYFQRLKTFGDFPIITEPLPDNMGVLTEASRRSPRNEVARFILEDLDKAALLMSDVDLSSQYINRDLALLFKSRVALYEGTWLKYFKGSAFVPGGEDWPGAAANPGYAYPSGSIDNEIEFFLKEAMAAAKEVGDKYVNKLTANTGVLQQSESDPVNPYYNMFCDEDLSGYDEVLLWRQYARGLVVHNVNAAAGRGNYRMGLTRGYVQNFLMADGTPVYTHGSYADGDGYYMGDKTIADVRKNRDSRLSVFLKEPGQKNILFELDNNEGTEVVFEEPYPAITLGDNERGYATGYAIRKGGNFNRKYYANGGGYTGAPCFRAVEALLNYMEASYELNHSIDGTADSYWRAIRNRANVDPDYNKTIALTDMNKEAENDWGAYSGGTVINDATLYNIRRERRCEFLSEGFRDADLKRWRSYDQLINNPAHLEGMHLWNTPMTAWYDNLKADGSNDSNVSSPERSEYLRPFERIIGQTCYDGCTWRMAHYLNPLPINEMMLTSPDGASPDQSVLYQNPYWPMVAGQPAIK